MFGGVAINHFLLHHIIQILNYKTETGRTDMIDKIVEAAL